MRRRDWAIWLFALVIAIVLWVYVVVHQNLTRTLQVPVEVTGVPTGMVARAEPAAASVAVTGPRDTVERLSLDNVRVRVALPAREPGSYRARLRVAVLRGMSTRVSPQQVRVSLQHRPQTSSDRDRVPPRTVPIVLTGSGQPARGYRVDTIDLEPTMATITGDAGVVAAVHLLPTAPLALQDARDDVEARLPLAPPAGVAVLHPGSVHVIVHIRQGLPIVPPLSSEEAR
jgi:YbbR domain-containing protein